jgi:hypothetical protein
LVNVLFGSGRLFPHDAADMLRAADYEGIRVLPAAPGVPIGMTLLCVSRSFEVVPPLV